MMVTPIFLAVAAVRQKTRKPITRPIVTAIMFFVTVVMPISSSRRKVTQRRSQW